MKFERLKAPTKWQDKTYGYIVGDIIQLKKPLQTWIVKDVKVGNAIWIKMN
jgi:hypothetical protein